jgi:hypothetical protein
MPVNKPRLVRGVVAALTSIFLGVSLCDTVVSDESDVEMFYSFDIADEATSFTSLSGNEYREHALWGMFSEERILSRELFENNPYAGYEIEYRNRLLTKFTGVRYASSVRVLDPSETPEYIKRAAPFKP